ncbi:MAG: hypothetical protein GXC76_00310 [Rhodanobacteraceae bacterium]|jgi:hypothetical protein|nr:hypothetical protein [Rhodanobacteraceae bacterium]
MRQIYTSPRMENIQRVVALMTEQGIETSIANRRAYQGADWKRFSYSAKGDRDSWPQVWVVRAEDQTAARRILRDAGLEPATRFADELAASRGLGDAAERRRHLTMRIKIIMLTLIAAVAGLIAWSQLGGH